MYWMFLICTQAVGQLAFWSGASPVEAAALVLLTGALFLRS